MPMPQRPIRQKPLHLCIAGRQVPQYPWVVMAVLVKCGEIGIGIARGEILITGQRRVCGYISAAKAALAAHMRECRMARGVMVDLRPAMPDKACRHQFQISLDFHAFAWSCAATLRFAVAVAPVRLPFKRCGTVNRRVPKERQTITMPVKGFAGRVIQPPVEFEICRRAAA